MYIPLFISAFNNKSTESEKSKGGRGFKCVQDLHSDLPTFEILRCLMASIESLPFHLFSLLSSQNALLAAVPFLYSAIGRYGYGCFKCHIWCIHIYVDIKKQYTKNAQKKIFTWFFKLSRFTCQTHTD